MRTTGQHTARQLNSGQHNRELGATQLRAMFTCTAQSSRDNQNRATLNKAAQNKAAQNSYRAAHRELTGSGGSLPSSG